MFKIFVLSIALVCASAAEFPTCYECYGGVDSDCAKGTDTEFTCSSDVPYVCYSHEVETATDRWIARGCSMERDPDLCEIIAGNDAIIVHWCQTCDEDFCNA